MYFRLPQLLGMSLWMNLLIIYYVVYSIRYRQPAPDPHGSRTGIRYEWLACGTPLGCKIGISLSDSSSKTSINIIFIILIVRSSGLSCVSVNCFHRVNEWMNEWMNKWINSFNQASTVLQTGRFQAPTNRTGYRKPVIVSCLWAADSNIEYCTCC